MRLRFIQAILKWFQKEQTTEERAKIESIEKRLDSLEKIIKAMEERNKQVPFHLIEYRDDIKYLLEEVKKLKERIDIISVFGYYC